MHYAVEPSLIPKIKFDYLQGKGSVRECCVLHGVGEDFKTVEAKAAKDKWKKQRDEHLKSFCEKPLEAIQNRAKEWESKVFSTALAEWDLATSSIQGIVGSGDGGIDPEALGGYVRARKLLDDMARRALGLVDPAQRIDLTSGGKSLGDSFGDAMRKLQESTIPAPTPEEVDRLIECEIIEEEGK